MSGWGDCSAGKAFGTLAYSYESGYAGLMWKRIVACAYHPERLQGDGRQRLENPPKLTGQPHPATNKVEGEDQA